MITGFETAVAKTAMSAAARAAAPTKHFVRRTIARRQLKQELRSGASVPEIEDFLNKLEPGKAKMLVDFVGSAEVKNLAINLAAENLIGHSGRQGNRISNELKSQLSSLLSLKSVLSDTDRDVATEIVFAALSQAVSASVSELIESSNPLPAATKTAIFKVQDSHLDCAIRNSVLLAGITDLGAYQTFEDQFRLQVKNLFGTMRLPHAGTTRRVPYKKLYVQPRVSLPREENDTRPVGDSRLAIQDLTRTTLRLVLLGDPGGGKSTLSLKLTYDCATNADPGEASIPFLVVLREYAAEMSKHSISLIEYLEQMCKVPYALNPPANALEYCLLNGRAFVIFDGLDELLDTALRRRVVDAVTGFAHRYPTTPILVTSRRVGYSDAPLDPDLFDAFTLCEFDSSQVTQYVKNWFDLDESIQPGRRNDLRRSFIADSQFVQDLRVNPLMLSLMCGIYASENYIPRNRPDVYEKCALLLFDSWDKQRGIKAALPFDAHVQAAMRSLALWLYPQQASHQGLPRAKLIGYMKEYLIRKRFDDEDEAENAATQFIDFCKGRAWVLTDVGAELYGFTHRTFLEYFAASQIVRENNDPAKLFEYLAERLLGGGWEVVAQLALQILNKAVEDGADDFLEILLSRLQEEGDVTAKRKLLEFAAQALTYIVPRPPILSAMAAQVIDFYSRHWQIDKPDVSSATPLYLMLGASAENLPLVSRYLYDHLVSLLEANPSNSPVLSIALYTDVFAAGRGSRARSYAVGNNVDFWNREAQISRPRFDSAIEIQQATQAWVAIYLLEEGHYLASKLIQDFGPQALFGIETTKGPNMVLPLILRILLSDINLGKIRVATDESTGMGRAQIEGLKEALLNLRLPWFEAPTPSILNGFIDYMLDHSDSVEKDSESRMSNSAFALFTAAIFDICDGSQRPRGNMRHPINRKERRRSAKYEAIVRTLMAREEVRGRRDPRLDSPNTAQGELFEAESNGVAAKRALAAARIDARTRALLEAWMENPDLKLIGERRRTPFGGQRSVKRRNK